MSLTYKKSPHFENAVKHKNVKMLICRSRLNQKNVGDTKCRSDLFNCVEDCVSNQTSWVTIIELWGEGYHRCCRVFDISMDATIASRPILSVRVNCFPSWCSQSCQVDAGVVLGRRPRRWPNNEPIFGKAEYY